MNRKIKALLIMQNKEAQIVKIPANIKFIKSLIGKELQRINLSNDAYIIANRNSKYENANRLMGDSLILGDFLIVNSKNGRRTSLNKKQIRKYCNAFKLRKHEKKVNYFKELYLKNYYANLNNKQAAA